MASCLPHRVIPTIPGIAFALGPDLSSKFLVMLYAVNRMGRGVGGAVRDSCWPDAFPLVGMLLFHFVIPPPFLCRAAGIQVFILARSPMLASPQASQSPASSDSLPKLLRHQMCSQSHNNCASFLFIWQAASLLKKDFHFCHISEPVEGQSCSSNALDKTSCT